MTIQIDPNSVARRVLNEQRLTHPEIVALLHAADRVRDRLSVEARDAFARQRDLVNAGPSEATVRGLSRLAAEVLWIGEGR